MIDRQHDLPITQQAKALGISRGSIYDLPRPVSVADLAIMRRMDELHLAFPFAGGRMLRDVSEQARDRDRSPPCGDADEADGPGGDRPQTEHLEVRRGTRSTRTCCAG